jgi:predicted AAA+ superfamily ATPase
VAPSDLLPEHFARVVGEQNPWHQRPTVPPALAAPVERPLAQRLWAHLLSNEPRRFHVILGPRRVGKTTVMYQTVRHLLDAGVESSRLWWLRLDHPELGRTDLGDLVRRVIEGSGATEQRPTILFLDEIVYADRWDLWLKTFYDDHWPVHVIATASASSLLHTGRSESGVGRWNELELTPYLFSEYLDLATGVGDRPAEPVHEAGSPSDDIHVERTLAGTLGALGPHTALVSTGGRNAGPATGLETARKTFMLVGGFPELLMLAARRGTPEDGELTSLILTSQQTLRDDAVERAVYKDIPTAYDVRDPALLERLLYVLAGQVTGVLSPRKICQDLDNLSQPTFDKYLSYLERTFLVFTLQNYSGSEAAVQKRGRKLYFVDGAVRNAALQRGLALLDNPTEMGRLVENLVAATLRSLARHSGTRLFHWRDGNHEVDLVLDHPEEPIAVEVGSSAEHSRHGLQRFIERYPRFRHRCYVVAPRAPIVHPATTASGVGTLPLGLFLVACGRQAEAALAQRLPGS